jgi:hypothetical protein
LRNRPELRRIAAPKHGGQLCKGFVDVKDAFQQPYHASHDPGVLWIARVAVTFAVYDFLGKRI